MMYKSETLVFSNCTAGFLNMYCVAQEKEQFSLISEYRTNTKMLFCLQMLSIKNVE